MTVWEIRQTTRFKKDYKAAVKRKDSIMWRYKFRYK